MDKLFIDIGNSRVKWATVSDGNYEFNGVCSASDFVTSPEFLALLGNFQPEMIFISSVGTPEFLESVKQLLLEQVGIFPVMLTSQKSCCGLVSGYEEFHKLGDDRWMAMQGALALLGESVIVIDAGTAMTIDAIVAREHIGGFIVPGLTSLSEALIKDTANLTQSIVQDVNEAALLNSPDLLARNTTSAIMAGGLYMTAAYINTLISDLSTQLQIPFKIALTGGNATRLKPLIDSPVTLIPDLVLRGMVNIQKIVKKS